MKSRKCLVTLVAMVMVVCSVLTVSAKTPKDSERAYVKVSNSLNLREGPSKSYKVLSKLKSGDLVDIVEKLNNGWSKVKTEEGVEGYVSDEYIVIPEVDASQYKIISVAVITANSSTKDRNFNMSKACEKINGITLDVGEEFNWYGDKERGIEAVVGPASKANGYKKANVILGGRYVPSYGGGVCQVSTAVYNCIYKLDITPTEHEHHSKPSSYVPKGMDATVSYPNKNFAFENTYKCPIMLEAYADGKQVVVVAYEVLQ